MSIAGGLFNSNTKDEKGGDTKTTADGDATATTEEPVDLTTAIPGFDDADEGMVIETGGEFRDVEGDLDRLDNEDVEGISDGGSGDDLAFDVDSTSGDIRLDPES